MDPSTTTLTLEDPTGAFNNRNPRSPYYGQLGRNTPLRYSVDGANVALVLPPGDVGRVTTPDAAALDITGDLDLRADLTPTSWDGDRGAAGWPVLGKASSGQFAYWLTVQSDGRLVLSWSTTGSNILSVVSTLAVPFTPGQRGAIRAVLDVNNGASGRTTTFYTSDTIAGTWTQLGDAVIEAGITSIFAGTAALQIGDLTAFSYAPIGRRFHAVEVRSGIGGSIVANPIFTSQASGATGFTDAAGRTWSLAGTAQITSRRTRTVGEISEWAPRWHVSGNDVLAPVTAAGIMRRLGQGRRPLKSALTRGLPTLSPVAYWPLEDGRDSRQAYSPIAGVQPLTVSGLNMAADTSFPAADALPTIVGGATLTGAVPRYAGSVWEIDFHYKINSAPASSGTILEWVTTGVPWRIWRLRFGPTNYDLVVEDGTGATTLVTSVNIASNYGTGWYQFSVVAIPIGGDLFVITSGGSNTLVGASSGQVTSFSTTFGASLAGSGFGHLAVYKASTATPAGYETAWRGETAGDRVVRLGAEEAVTVDVWGDPQAQQAMGYQRPAQLVDLLAECEAADGGILMEDRERLGLVYQGRTSFYNRAPALTIPYGHLSELGPPRDDDTRIRNDRTVSRVNGSFGRWTLDTGSMSTQNAPAGVGLYEDSTSVNVADDSQCQPLAQWLVHLGTVDEARYPQVKILLHKYPQYIDAVTNLDSGSIIRVTGLPAHLPPGPLDLLVEGYEETLGPLSWEIVLTCSPAEPWQVGVVEDIVRGRLDTEGSQLASGVSSTATTLSVATTSGPVWSPVAADWPFDADLNGEIVTVTAVSGSTSPQSWTVIRSMNGVVKSHLSGAPVQLAAPTILAL
ncbi:hypothetical protein [Streptomyces sp. NPDC001594]|uniref:hypothetical protein n=1 Tax=Streptomyces sp. NPDC001594 TaxID=3364590 RepID=UPI0036B7D594